MMKVWVDDVRPAPEGWTWAKSYYAAILVLSRDIVTHISLDHDLGMKVVNEGESGIVTAVENKEEKTGYDVACWIEEHHYTQGFVVPVMFCHSANPVGRKRINQVIDKLKAAKWKEGKK